jgi:hypothetical protein
MIYVRKLNSRGLGRFKKYLNDLRDKPSLEPPFEILENSDYSDVFQDRARVEKIKFQHRTHMVEYLSKALTDLNASTGIDNKGLWNWLSLFYFNQVCPKDIDGKRKLGMNHRYILDNSFRYYYKHLLAGPFQTYITYGNRARLILHGAVHISNDIHHKLAERQNFITNPSIVGVADALYFDQDKSKPKPGAQSKTRGGSILRFINVIQQLELTFDLYSMSSEEILKLLPTEFDTWQDLQRIAG